MASSPLKNRTFELTNVNRDNFEKLCTNLLNVIKEKRPIESNNLECFSKFTTIMLRCNLMPKGENFDTLSRSVSDYWHYSLPSEKNPQRGCSYVQLYQMITMIQQNNIDSEIAFAVHNDTKKYSFKDKEILKRIKQSPGITFNELSKEPYLSNEDLAVRLSDFEKKLYISARRKGKYRYYILTDLGNKLYQSSFSETNNIWADQWTKDRLSTLIALLLLSREKKYNCLIQDLVYRVSLIPESLLPYVSNRILRSFTASNDMYSFDIKLNDFNILS